MMRDKFYNPEIIIPRLKEFKLDVVSNSYEIVLEQKHVTGPYREPTTKSLEFILSNCKSAEDIRIVRRYPRYTISKNDFQVMFFYAPREWYLAWCNMDAKYEEFFVKKYNLEVKQ